jgi:signal transduction histidine kinase
MSVKILLVDDLHDNLLALDGLLSQESVEIFTAKSGMEALNLMMTHDFALALIDVQMPGMSGFELAEFMRGTNRTRSVPIIFVTATAKKQSFSFKGYESGAVDFLLKPLDTHAVKSKVNIFIELYRNQLEQKRLLNELTKTQTQLEKAVHIRDEFMSIASHELKTPLTSLMLQAQFRKRNLRKADLALFSLDRLQKMFNDDERQLQRLTRLIDDMLDVARISSGKLSVTKDEFDLSELVKELAEQSAEQFSAAGCEVTVTTSEVLIGSWDRFRIEQVVMNLFTNAMRYGQCKPVSVAVDAHDGFARIVVKDQGLGIALENRERIFDRFERAVSANQVQGLGLGLYICRQILESHAGSIRVESVLGEGSSFIVELPLVTSELVVV